MEKAIIGLIEDIKIISNNKGELFKAKIDTGADTSSLDLSIATRLNLKLVGMASIKSAAGKSKRGKVTARIILAEKEMDAEFTIADRSDMNFPVLIGKNILTKGFLIDPTKE
ncbi:MAG: RimK/LysX family protein [Candidatus Nanoarchaeia archaeon]|nr:RimK/LysX family protein [Candidatus Nanoarchaeia archaeon]